MPGRCSGLQGSRAAGKSTLAQRVERRLFALGAHTFRLDGDNVRHGLNADLGFDEAGRSENIRRVADVGPRLAQEHGAIVLLHLHLALPRRPRGGALAAAGGALPGNLRAL